MSDLVERLRKACFGHPAARIPWPHYILHEAADRIVALEAENARLREALTPSAATKASYIGEFRFPLETVDGDTPSVTVPWTTIKQIMAAILNRALSKEPANG
jgi:hypothetical protein